MKCWRLLAIASIGLGASLLLPSLWPPARLDEEGWPRGLRYGRGLTWPSSVDTGEPAARAEPAGITSVASDQCAPCDGGYQSFAADTGRRDIVNWVKHEWPGAETSHLTLDRDLSTVEGNEGFFDMQLVGGGQRILFTKYADSVTGIVYNMEQLHYDADWLYIDFEWLDAAANNGTTWYRKFNATDGGPYLGQWAKRNIQAGTSFQISGPNRDCPSGVRDEFHSMNTILGVVHSPYTKCIYDARTGQTKPVKALVLASIYGRRWGKIRELYWYGKSEDNTETYGLIRWDWYERASETSKWVLLAGGCQMNKIVPGDPCIPNAVVNTINGSLGCVTLPGTSCP